MFCRIRLGLSHTSSHTPDGKSKESNEVQTEDEEDFSDEG